MSATLIGIVTVIYVFIAGQEGFAGKPDLSVVFGGYAFGNVGLLWAALR